MSTTFSPLTLAQAETALYFVPAGCERETWATIAAALNAEYGECAFDLFERWSSTGQNFNARDCKSTWKSTAKLTQIGIGTLLFFAKQHGWQAPQAKPLTERERQQMSADAATRAHEATERAHQAAKETQRANAEGQAKAERIFARSTPANPRQAYAVNKGISVRGLRQSGDALIVPMLDENGTLHNLQFIDAAGAKRYLSGARTKGLAFATGASIDDAERLIICEGLATALSLAQHCPTARVVAALCASNLMAVALSVRAQYPLRQLVIAADYDAPSAGYLEPGGIGLAKAQAVALATNAELWTPDVVSAGLTHGDFNDLHCSQKQKGIAA